MIFRVSLGQEAFDGHFALYFGAIDLAQALHVALPTEEDGVIILLIGAVVKFGHCDCELSNTGVLLRIVRATSRVAVNVVVEIPISSIGLVTVAIWRWASVCCAPS